MRKTLHRLAKGQGGQLLILVLVIMLVAMLIIPSSLALISSGIIAGNATNRRTQELYAADAGVQNALELLKIGVTTVPPITNFNGSGININVTIGAPDASNVYKVTSLATSTQPTTTSTTIVAYVSSAPGLFDYALEAIGDTGPTVSFTGGGGSNAAATATVSTAGMITDVTMTNSGSGYTTAPKVTFISDSANGADATATAHIAGGKVTNVTVTNGGYGYVYSSAPNAAHNGNITTSGASALISSDKGPDSVTIFANGDVDLPDTDVIGQIIATSGLAPGYINVKSSSGILTAWYPPASIATGIATVAGGIVTGVTITGGGSGYDSHSPTHTGVGFSGGGGSGATGTATIVGGHITGVTMTNHGSGYTSPPTVIFDKFPALTNAVPFDFGPAVQSLQSGLIDPSKADAANVTAPAMPGNGRLTPNRTPNWTVSASSPGPDWVSPGNCTFSFGTNAIVTMGILTVDGVLTAGGKYNLTFNGTTYVKGSGTSSIAASNDNGIPHSTTFNNLVYIVGNFDLNGNSGSSTINFNDKVYVGGNLGITGGGATINFNNDVYINGNLDLGIGSHGAVNFLGKVYIGGSIHTHGDGDINFNDNLYVGGAGPTYPGGYVLDLEGGNLNFGGILWANDPRPRVPTTPTTMYSAAGHKLQITGKGPIIITGNILVGGMSAALGFTPLIMSEFGYFKNTGGGDITAYLYAPYNFLQWGGGGGPGGTVSGAMTAHDLRINSSVNVSHAILPVFGGSSGSLQILTWNITLN